MAINLEESNSQVLKNISELQKNETQLYIELNDPKTTPSRREQIIQKINELSQMRLNLYANLKNMYSSQERNISSTSNIISKQLSALDAVENELNQMKLRMNALKEEDYNKLRLVQINTYYGKRYSSYAEVMKTIALLCIPIIILAILGNKGFVPTNIYILLMSIILIIGIILVGKQLLDIANRDNMNWDEYDWYFDKTKAPSTSTERANISNPWDLSMPSLTCIGSSCCYSGTTYDDIENVCLPNDVFKEKYPEKEIAVNNVLSKYGNVALKTQNSNAIINPIVSNLKM